MHATERVPIFNFSSRRGRVALALIAFLNLFAIFCFTYNTNPRILVVPFKHVSHRVLSAAGLNKYNGRRAHWPGWEKIETMFIFGDSYSDLAFRLDGAQPSKDIRFGNCDNFEDEDGNHVEFPGCIENKWTSFLSRSYNASNFLVYNMAVGGATIDINVVPPNWPAATPLADQVADKFLPTYTLPTSPAWDSHTTLFAFFFGVNDVVLTAGRDEPFPVQSLIASYKASLLTLYATGARNILLLNTVPLDDTEKWDDYASPEEQAIKRVALRAAIGAFNAGLARMAVELRAAHPALTLFALDVHSLYLDALADPHRFDQTDVIKMPRKRRKWCELDGEGHKREGRKFCSRPREEFFWEGIHPTVPVQNLTAAVAVKDCFAEGGPKGYCDWGDGE